MSIRSYTHGYDLFLPDEIVAWHMHQDAPLRRHWDHGDDVVREKNLIAFERLRCLAYSDNPEDQKSLGRYGLGRQRSRADYERFAGMVLRNKRAHPDVYTGRSPDPVTIKTEADWAECVTYEAYSKSNAC